MLRFWFYKNIKIKPKNFGKDTFQQLEKLEKSEKSLKLLMLNSWSDLNAKKNVWYRYYSQLDTGNLAFILYIEELIKAKGFSVRAFRDELLFKNEAKIIKESSQEDITELVNCYLTEFVVERKIITLLLKLTSDEKLSKKLELRKGYNYNKPATFSCVEGTTLTDNTIHRELVLDLLESHESGYKIPKTLYWLEVVKHYPEIVASNKYINSFNSKIKLEELSNIIKAIGVKGEFNYLLNLINITGLPLLLSCSYFRSDKKRNELITLLAKNKPDYLLPYLFSDEELDLAVKNTSCLASIVDKKEFNIKLVNYGYKLDKVNREMYLALLPSWQGSLEELTKAITKL